MAPPWTPAPPKNDGAEGRDHDGAAERAEEVHGSRSPCPCSCRPTAFWIATVVTGSSVPMPTPTAPAAISTAQSGSPARAAPPGARCRRWRRRGPPSAAACSGATCIISRPAKVAPTITAGDQRDQRRRPRRLADSPMHGLEVDRDVDREADERPHAEERGRPCRGSTTGLSRIASGRNGSACGRQAQREQDRRPARTPTRSETIGVEPQRKARAAPVQRQHQRDRRRHHQHRAQRRRAGAAARGAAGASACS